MDNIEVISNNINEIIALDRPYTKSMIYINEPRDHQGYITWNSIKNSSNYIKQDNSNLILTFDNFQKANNTYNLFSNESKVKEVREELRDITFKNIYKNYEDLQNKVIKFASQNKEFTAIELRKFLGLKEFDFNGYITYNLLQKQIQCDNLTKKDKIYYFQKDDPLDITISIFGNNKQNKFRSKREALMAQLFENDGYYSYINEMSFNDCKYKKVLRFDFYLPEIEIFIEIDGLQHDKPIEFFGGEETFRKQKEKDEIKNQYCGENLIRIKESDDLEAVYTKKIRPLIKKYCEKT